MQLLWTSLLLLTSLGAQQVPGLLSHDFSAEEMFNTGSSDGILCSDGSLFLNDMELLENDGPGAGLSEKGPYMEPLQQGVLVKKVFQLKDSRAIEAHVVLYMAPQKPKSSPPYYLLVNGHRMEGNPVPWHEGVWHWVKIDPTWLVQGSNEVVLGCDAPAGSGFDLLFARSDEYERGGGCWIYRGNTARIAAGFLTPPATPNEDFEPVKVGETSGKSFDAGATWSMGKLGPENSVPGEYTIRLNLHRHIHEGSIASAPLDLWSESADIPRPSVISDFSIQAKTELPPGTRVEWSRRYADTPDRLSAAWTPYVPFNQELTPRRFVQIRARLSTSDPGVSPKVLGLNLSYHSTPETTPNSPVYVQNTTNPELHYSNYITRFEDSTHPDLARLRQRLELDTLVAGSSGDFETVNRVRHKVSGLWRHALPYPGYPEWNAQSVLDRNEKQGWGGMCMQFTVVYMQALQSLGYTARHVNIFNHETTEVYVDELSRWIHEDAESLFDSYEYDTRTGAPLNVYQQHTAFLRRYNFTPDRPIPWMSTEAWCNWTASGIPEQPQNLTYASPTPWINTPDAALRPPQHNLAGFFRIIPRNDFVSNPTPRPLNNGSTFWPWNGYLNWYDPATPRKLQYALHSNRENDFYPTLNQVAFTTAHGKEEGTIVLDLYSITPNFDRYEMREGTGDWKRVDSNLVWRLRPNALNHAEFRVINKLGMAGQTSKLSLFWNYTAPYAPRDATGK